MKCSNEQEKSTSSKFDFSSDVIGESLDEFLRSGIFERVFPLKSNIDYYSQFVRRPREENLLLWEYMRNNPEDY